MSLEKDRPLPKFGDWDEKNPASAYEFTVIFARARDDNNTNNKNKNNNNNNNGNNKASSSTASISKKQKQKKSFKQPFNKKRWYCCD
ncbi:hypothetical protein LguiA_003474 [Lonicera macranthoides]